MITVSAFQQLAFVKEGLVDDPDWSLPNGAVPPDDRVIEVRWRLSSASGDVQAHAVMFFVTLRDANGAEVAGTFKAVALWKSLSGAWRKIGEVGAGDDPAHDASEGLRLDVGGDGQLALRLHTITAPGATKIYVDVQQWGVG